MENDLLLRFAAKFVLPWVLLFALYVLFHGHYGAGGGFQAGVVAASGLILYALVFGLERTMRFLPPRFVETLLPLGVLLYAAVGVAGFFTGGAFLDYDGLGEDQVHGQEWGVFLVEMGVFVTVAATMVALFYSFAGRTKP